MPLRVRGVRQTKIALRNFPRALALTVHGEMAYAVAKRIESKAKQTRAFIDRSGQAPAVDSDDPDPEGVPDTHRDGSDSERRCRSRFRCLLRSVRRVRTRRACTSPATPVPSPRRRVCAEGSPEYRCPRGPQAPASSRSAGKSESWLVQPGDPVLAESSVRTTFATSRTASHASTSGASFLR